MFAHQIQKEINRAHSWSAYETSESLWATSIKKKKVEIEDLKREQGWDILKLKVPVTDTQLNENVNFWTTCPPDICLCDLVLWLHEPHYSSEKPLNKLCGGWWP